MSKDKPDAKSAKVNDDKWLTEEEGLPVDEQQSSGLNIGDDSQGNFLTRPKCEDQVKDGKVRVWRSRLVVDVDAKKVDKMLKNGFRRW